MGLFFLILALVILFLILSNIYVFIRIFKHKKRYFFTVGIGFIIKIKLFELCFVIYQRKGFNIVRVKKGGFLHTMKPIDIKNINKEFIICITENIKIKQLILKIILGTDEAKNTAIYGGMLSAGLDFNRFVLLVDGLHVFGLVLAEFVFLSDQFPFRCVDYSVVYSVLFFNAVGKGKAAYFLGVFNRRRGVASLLYLFCGQVLLPHRHRARTVYSFPVRGIHAAGCVFPAELGPVPQ